MGKMCPIISNHEEFLECQGEKCLFFKNNDCIILEISNFLNNIESNTSGTENELTIVNKKIKNAK